MDKLGTISAFLKVAELGSFAHAGREIGVSGSAISKSVSRLEDRLRVRLFNRTTRALSLTDDGREFRDRCAPILSELDDAEKAMFERAAEPSGALRISLPVALGRMKVLPILGQLTDKFPDLRIEVSLSDEVIDMVVAGVDVIVRIGEPRDSRLMMKRIGRVRYIVCAAPSYLEKKSVPNTPDDLSRHDCIQRLPYPCSPHGNWRFSEPIGRSPFERTVSGSLHFDSADAVLEAALAGSGLAQLHDYMATPYLATGELVQILGTYVAEGPPICLLYPSARLLTPKVRAFLDIVSKHFSRSPAKLCEYESLAVELPDNDLDTLAYQLHSQGRKLAVSR